MIAALTGTILLLSETFTIIDVSGVGYKVFVSSNTLTELKATDGTVSLWTHQVVREDALDLYGFMNRGEAEFFQLLIGISGVGPKSALGILSLGPVETMKAAISAGDADYLTKVSGIGKKSAQKIVLELQDKVNVLEGETYAEERKEESDTIAALQTLGYSALEAREALKHVSPDTTGTKDRLKAALKVLG